MKKIISGFSAAVLMFGCMASAASAAGWDNWDNWNSNNNRGGSQNTASSTVKFYVEFSGTQRDTNGNITSQDKSYFTSSVFETTTTESLSTSYSIAYDKETNTQEDVLQYVAEVPDEDGLFTQLKATYEGSGSYIRANTGEVISWDSFNSKGFRFEWYVFKYESGDCWHVDGRIIDKSTDLPIGIIDPDEKADEEKAACVRYDVETGRFVPGFMDTKLNRPHSWAKGDNDTEIVKGFDDVYYTVLDEDTFAQNNNIIPTKLMDAAETINTLASARLASLSEDTQYQYGRIDSQAWKKEYIKRNDKGTLWMTPYITEELENAGVTREDYIWLAMGDTTGHITTIWVMDRDMAGIENLVEGE